MKKLLLFITILAIGLYYIDQKTHWITNRTHEIKDVTKSSTIFLHKMSGQEHVHGYDVYITGYIDGKAKIKLYDKSRVISLYKNEDISGDINIVWHGDWYTKVLKIEYEPIADVKGGELSLEYAFYGL